LATIAKYELAKGLFTNELNWLSQNAMNQNYHHRLAAVQTMGYISEFTEDEGFLTQQHIC
jgi:hypothetical protein